VLAESAWRADYCAAAHYNENNAKSVFITGNRTAVSQFQKRAAHQHHALPHISFK
jgi:hypothetical protein